MIFSRQKMELAFMYASVYYNKILLVNLSDDSFEPIKVDDKEWNNLEKTITFSEWLKGFASSDLVNHISEDLNSFIDINILRKTETARIFEYQKLVKDEYHDMCMTFMPISDDLAYIFVKDLSKMRAKLEI